MIRVIKEDFDIENEQDKRLRELYDDISFELTNFENSEDPETTDEEWRDVFYNLLVEVHNVLAERIN